MNPEEIRKQVELAWLSRAEAQGFGKPSSARYRKAELEFFSGAMSAFQALHPGEAGKLSSLVPARWILNVMTGDNIVRVK